MPKGTGEPSPSKTPQARSRLARSAVIDAARELFLERSYSGTTMEAISDRSTVPPATLYRLFSSKYGVLKALFDAAIAGDDAEVSIAERPDTRALLEDPDPRSLLFGFADMVCRINARVGALYLVLAGAAGVDPEANSLFAKIGEERQKGQRHIARALSKAGALGPGLREVDAADLIHALLSPELYQLLVVDRSWDVARYRSWVTAVLEQQLLATDDRPLG